MNKPTYEPDCHCYKDPDTRNDTHITQRMLFEHIPRKPEVQSFFRNQLSWSVTPIGER